MNGAPGSVKGMSLDELAALAARTRARIVETVAVRGGHLASSLGAVELTIALLRVFDPPSDRIVWDVGHQAYAWKLLTDRWDSFATLRSFHGVSGFPDPRESPCDAFIAGHAGSALPAAAGMAAARDLSGGDWNVVAVTGDASLTNGMCLEALCRCAESRSKTILVLNDNGTPGADAFRPGKSFFGALGLEYIGPVDGHDIGSMEVALAAAKASPGTVVVHVVTRKGRGFAPAEEDPARWHGTGPFSPDNPSAEDASCGEESWSAAFGRALCGAAREDGRICAVVAAMGRGTGTEEFAREFPTRFFDVGIREECAVTFAAGLAMAGMRPVVAIYSTFLQRAFDQIVHDVCILKLPVTFAVDRAGCVGRDGKTHHGMLDVAMCRAVPGLSVLAPSSEEELQAMLRAAVARGEPAAIRYPRGAVPHGKASDAGWGKAESVLRPDAGVQLWALGDQLPKALSAAEILSSQGVEAGVVDARFAKPFDAELLAAQRAAGAVVVSVENGTTEGGFGEAIGADVRTGWPDGFVGHGTVGELEVECRFTAADVAAAAKRKAR